MKNYLLKKTILVKANDSSKEDSHVLVLDIERDLFFKLVGDVAKLMMILYSSGLTNKALNTETASKELENQSESFLENNHKEECIKEAFQYFTQQNLLDVLE